MGTGHVYNSNSILADEQIKYPALSNSRTDLVLPAALLDSALAKSQQISYTDTTNTSTVLWDLRRNKRKILRSTVFKYFLHSL